jgi:hypothetical protein
MWELRPTREGVMEHKQAIEFLEIALKTLEELVHDKDFYQDLSMVAKLAAAAPGVPPKETAEFRRFLDGFLAAERALLIQSKINEDAAADILEEIARIVEVIKDVQVDILGLAARLNLVIERIRTALRDEMETLRRETRHRDIWRVIKGCAIVGIDSGSVAAVNLALPIIGGVLAAGPALLSIKVGAAVVSDVMKDKI